jgi:ParB family chromosome partitioning protein
MLSKRRSGLGSLIPGAEFSEVTGAIESVPIATIAVNPFQPRRVFAPEGLDELADSIRQYGILQPLTVRRRDGGYELIAGERRLLASRKAGLTAVPVLIRICSDEEMLALALVENLQREDLNAMEAARSYQQLVDQFGLSHTEIAERVGKNRSTVANTMRLLALPETMQQSIFDGAISEGHGRALLAVENKTLQHKLFQATLKRGLSVRALEALVNPKPRRTERKHPLTPTTDANLLAVQDELQLSLSARVQFKLGSDATHGTLEIDYYTAEDLNRIYEAFCK